MQYDVVDVHAVMPLALQIRFADGTAGQVRFEPSHLTGVFEALKDPIVFAQARVEAGAVTWPGDLDAPDKPQNSSIHAGWRRVWWYEYCKL